MLPASAVSGRGETATVTVRTEAATSRSRSRSACGATTPSRSPAGLSAGDVVVTKVSSTTTGGGGLPGGLGGGARVGGGGPGSWSDHERRNGACGTETRHRGARPREDLRMGDGRGARASRRVAHGRARRLRRDHGRVGKRQEHAHEHPRLPRRPDDAAATCSTASTCGASTTSSSPQVRNRKIGFVFQSFNLIPRDVGARATWSCRWSYAGMKRRDVAAGALDALEAVGLADRVDHLPVRALRRPAAARRRRAGARRRDPAMILADEPTGNLDSESTREVLDIFPRLNAAGPHGRAHHPRGRRRRVRAAGHPAARRSRRQRRAANARARAGMIESVRLALQGIAVEPAALGSHDARHPHRRRPR